MARTVFVPPIRATPDGTGGGGTDGGGAGAPGARVRHLTGGRVGAVDFLSGPEALVGRDPDACGVAIHPTADISVGRVHARIWHDGDGWLIEDRRSTHGTYVGGERLDRAVRLRDGTEFVVGGTGGPRLRFEEVAVRPPPGREPAGDAGPRSRDPWTEDRPQAPPDPPPGPEVAWLWRALVASLVVIVLLGLGFAWQQVSILTQRRLHREMQSRSDAAWEATFETGAPAEDRQRYIEELVASARRDEKLSRGVFGLPTYRAADPMEAHIQELMAAFTGLPSNVPPPARFLAAVRASIRPYVRDRTGFCRLRALEPVLVGMLRGQGGTGGPEAGSWEHLVYLAWVESRLNPRACSVAGARGMWQFMPATGRQYGLRVAPGVDERCDWRKSTGAAARFLRDLFADFGVGYPFLAIASYNSGAVRTQRVKRAREIPKEQRNYLAFYQAGLLPEETMHYVPRFVAAAYVGKHYTEAAEWLNRAGGPPVPTAEPSCAGTALPSSEACSDACLPAPRTASPGAGPAPIAADDDADAVPPIPIVWGE